ncbi:hypothetical protein [Salmonella enterica]|uniref:hypothetical protein n=1 Tax=Salmonella enterica TaxID=28901 RepID=UPI0015FFACEF|nr:hypothetical protein [Salmonella enterica]EHS8053947.1 hypothetical protein [Salmonella enterica subsp. enterica]EHS8059486.1 hypothetical protein [Salmonella enterica subsp. enterica]EIW7313288.1 hypothetical protein [Salmonella enterica]
MTIDKQTLCVENAFDIESQLYELANNEIECDSFAVTSTNENGTEIEFERPITDLALEAASTINALLKRLESKEKLVADLVAENEALKYQKPTLSAMMSCLDVFYAGEGMPELAMMAAYNILRKSVGTPDTDAFLAEVRAQGVERYAAQLKSEAELADEAGWDGAAKFLISESGKVLAFAAQIRQEAAK